VRHPEELVERVLMVVEAVPSGWVTTYGAIGDVVGSGPRRVGSVLATHGGAVPWWRVVRADGSLPPSHDARARRAYEDEQTPLRASGRVDMVAAYWQPPADVDGLIGPTHR
jgi:alkylated DNA nucleotide flippase Atl1